MRREDAEAHKDRLQPDDHHHTYLERGGPGGEWEVVRIDLTHRISRLRAEQGRPTDPHDDRSLASQSAIRRSNAASASMTVLHNDLSAATASTSL
jgi:hypothetical protein